MFQCYVSRCIHKSWLFLLLNRTGKCQFSFQSQRRGIPKNVKVTQACPTLCDPVECSPPRLLCPWNSREKNTGVGSHSLLQRIFLTQGLNQGVPHCGLYCLSHQGSPKISPAQMLPPVLHESESVSHSVMTDSLQPYGLYPPGPYVHGILQARIMEWVAIPFSRGSSQPRD